MANSAGTAYITILPDTDRFVATLVAQMKAAGTAVSSSGDDANIASGNFRKLTGAMSDAGNEAANSAADYIDMGKGVDSVNASIIDLNKNMRGGIGQFGGPPGKGISTDIGSALRGFGNLAQAGLAFATTVLPAVNLVLAAVVGLVSLLGVAVIAAGALAVALGATAGVMAFAAFKWRDLLVQTEKGAETWRGALIAIEAQGFIMAQGLVKSFSSASDSGKDLWTTVGELGVKGLKAMEPIIASIVDHVKNFIAALNGATGASSPFLDFIRTWILEWKVLLNIVNQDIAPGAGILGFFEKYEKPAKAFVEGIAQVINAIRKMAAMGLGLNMDQLAEEIRNVFTALSGLVQIYPKFGNSLVAVGLELSRFLVRMLPLIDAAIDIGSSILQYIVAPLVDLALVITGTILEIPLISWLAAVAGGFALVALAISKLSFGALKFGDVIKFMGAQFLALSQALGTAVYAMLGASEGMSILNARILGGGIVVLALAAAFFILLPAIKEVSAAAKEADQNFDELFTQFEAGRIGGIEVLRGNVANLAEGFNSLSNVGKAVYAVQHFDKILQGMNATAIVGEEAVQNLMDQFHAIGTQARTDVLTGSLSEGDIAGLKAAKDYVDEINRNAGMTGFGELTAAGQEWAATLAAIDQAYQEHAINAGQYATMLEQLGATTNSTGEEVDLMALKIKGAANTIAEALVKVNETATTPTGGLAEFAKSTGQAFVSLKSDAVAAMTDLAAGVEGSGAKVNEFFQAQADVISQWKSDTADSFNFVKEALAGLAGDAAVSFGKIRSTLEQAKQDLINYGNNWDRLKKLGASQELLRQVEALGTGGANVLQGLVQGGKKGVEQVNKLVKSGVDLSTALAENMATALNITMEKLTAAIEIMVSRTLGIPLRQLQDQVDRVVSRSQAKIDSLHDKHVTITLETVQKGAASIRGIRGGRPDIGGGPAPVGGVPFPKPDPAVVKSAYAEIAKNGTEGFRAGLESGSASVSKAAAKMSADSAKAAARAIGAQSPAKAFIAIGRDAVDGLIKGVSEGSSMLVGQMTRAGNAMASGLRTGLIAGLEGVKAQAVSTVQELVNAVNQVLQNASPSKVFYKIGMNIGEGMRLGIDDSMQGVHASMRAHAGELQSPFGRMHHGRVGVPAFRKHGAAGGSAMTGEMRIRDWRTGLASLEGELEWDESVAYR